MAENSNRDESIFDAAVQLSTPAERAAYVRQACGDDADLRHRVEELLSAHEQASSFLNQPADGAPLGVPPAGGREPAMAEAGTRSEMAGDRIGRYKLLEKIGEGGFGVVWMAEQEEPVRRRVALKVIKLGMDTREVIARFEAERQALALMDHPNIAKVHDGGATDAGRPYFVMELVRGIRITDYCDQQHLSTVERLKLFTQVCQAVQHAHQKGIIHRDLKPSNILVTVIDGPAAEACPKVIDFGIAKATGQQLTDKTLFTRFAQFLGTPAYMSPEQAELTSLDIDTRSDIYSLGVVLYELLTGRTPFDAKELLAAGLDEIRRVIREVEPLKPSTRITEELARLGAEQVGKRENGKAGSGAGPQGESHSPPRSRRDLRELQRRVSLLRGDLDWIVMKCLEKDRTRRYETATALAADIQHHLNSEPVTARPPTALYRWQKFASKHRAGVSVAAGFILLLTAATVVSSTLALWANRERHAAQRATTAARESEADTKAFANFLVSDVLATARPRGMQGGLGIDVSVAKALEKADANLQKSFQGRPRAEATARHAIGVTWRDLGKHAAAEPHLRRALEIREREFGEASTEAWEARNSYGVLLNERARYPEAVRLLERNLEIFRASAATNLSIESAVRGMINLAGAWRQSNRVADAFKLHQEAVDLAAARLGPDAPVTWDARSYLASAQFQAGRFQDASAFYEQELPWLTKHRGPKDVLTISSMNNLGLAYLQSERLDKALPLLTNAFNLMPAIFGPANPETMTARDNLASAYERLGRIRDAIPLAEENLKLREQTLSPTHPNTLDSVLTLAVLYTKGDQLSDALRLFQQAYDRSTASRGPDHRATLNALSFLAQAHAQAGDFTNAIPLLETALQRTRTALGTNDTTTHAAINNLAVAYAKVGRRSDALLLYEEAVQLCTNQFGLSSSRSLPAMHNLAVAWKDAGRLNDAIDLMRQTLRGYERKPGASQSGLIKPMTDLAQMLVLTKKFEEAEPLLLKACEALQQRAAERPSRSRTQQLNEAAGRLVQLYEAWDAATPDTSKAAKAAEWKRKLAELEKSSAKPPE